MATSNNDRIVVLIDMDCFFCQVETKLRPEYAGKPLAVVQYNQWQLGGIIAVNYEAREYGVTRHMRGEEAKEKCRDIVLASVPCLRGKADTSRYRNAGREVIDVIKNHCNVIERASVDEAYLDITDIVIKRMSTNLSSSEYIMTQLPNTFVVGYSEVGKNDEEERSKSTRSWIINVFEEFEDIQAQRLAIAGVIVEQIRADVYDKTGFRCSAGIAQNKILAKLACGLHKPNRQTILPASAVPILYSTLPIKKVRNLGGKFGDVVIESLNCNVMGDLLQYSLQYLQKRFDDKTGLWLYNIARGVDNEPVTMRLVSKSIGACKKFPGKQAITSLDVLKHWANELSAEVCERLEQDLEENERRATLVTICYHYYQNKTTVSQSRSYTLNSYKPEKMAGRCVEIISKSTQCPIAYLGISAGKFVLAKGSENFRNFFKSNKLGYHLEIDDQIKNINVENMFSVDNTTKILKSNLNLDKVVNIISNDNEINNESSNKLQHVEQNSNIREQISDSRTDYSPTSRRLNNLINSLNKRNKTKFYKKRINSSNLNNSLDQNDFKESFFMNVFSKKGNNAENTHTNDVEFIELNDNTNMNIEFENIKEDDIKNKEGRNSDIKLDLNVTNNCKKYMNDEIKNEPSSSSIKLNENNEIYEEQDNAQYIIQLNEIFPDLNNIDPTVVALLPLDLQEKAKLYMKVENKKDNIKEVLVKTSKRKNKSKTNTFKGKKNNDISSFLIKKSSSNLIEVPSKQCLKCYQMIPISKYQEHWDFHVAESLQWEINNSMLQTINIKRKDNTNDVHTNSIKRRPNSDISTSDKSHKSIT
ncbi:PREDICTED: DNA polymerase eta [Eufriesea mexicana]|uniref:DNA polymerase eta n=1 Tax=Eufriesea mexicana TaxID=516756 RepID=UPI00083C0D64|nr:PREDICTED: DNA polymerase eta [Eufriesea mexicana]